MIVYISHIADEEGVLQMAKTFIIRNFPEELHKDAKICAVMEEVTLQELILRAIKLYVERAKADFSETGGTSA
jgi:predicted HicB family RNase H-like nuclease